MQRFKMVFEEDDDKSPFLIVTLCGSYRYEEEMQLLYQDLTDKDCIVLMPAIGCEKHDREYYRDLQFAKIAMSDAVIVVGDSVNQDVAEEIREARRKDILVLQVKLEKKVWYFRPISLGGIFNPELVPMEDDEKDNHGA